LISDPHQTQAIVQQFVFLQSADERFRKSFFEHVSLARIDVGRPICDEGMQCGHLALVNAGVARVYKLGENGREITLYRISGGESCILTASCIIGGRPFPAFAICEEPIEALVISSPMVIRWTNEFSAWRNYLFGLIGDRLGDVISVIEEIAFRRVDRRLAHYLLQRLEPTGSGSLNITHQAIASDLGTSREVVSRILKDFEHQGLISVARGIVCLNDRQGLAEISHEH
jgi:CRP/FNR family transcriptional regulator, anaerobic regulatory protein